MTIARKNYTQKFKDEAVELFLASDLPTTHIASSVGVMAGTQSNWFNKYREQNPERTYTG